MALNRALANREILRTICQFSDPSDDLELLCVSHLFFDAAIPFIWGSIRGVENLLALLPGVACTSTEKEPEIMKIVSLYSIFNWMN